MSSTLSGPLVTLNELLFVVIADIGLFLVGLGIDLVFEFRRLVKETNASHRLLIILCMLAIIAAGTNAYITYISHG